MDTFMTIYEIAQLKIIEGQRALVETWRDDADARIGKGGGQLSVLTGASSSGSSFSKTLVADPLVFSRACSRALLEADGILKPACQATFFHPQL